MNEMQWSNACKAKIKYSFIRWKVETVDWIYGKENFSRKNPNFFFQKKTDVSKIWRKYSKLENEILSIEKPLMIKKMFQIVNHIRLVYFSSAVKWKVWILQ